MDKVKEILLADFKRANKVRKVKLATKYGLTVEEYLKWLNTEDVVNTPVVENTEVTTEVKPTDIVIAFDTTGSMSSYIDNVKNHITSLIPELFNNTKNLKIGVVAFGDYCDMESKNVFGNAYQVLDLSEDTSGIISFVKNAKDTSGGDSDEFYELVIKKIQEETSWREGSNKSILLIGDAEPHDLGYTKTPFITNNQIDWKLEAIKCKELGIKIDTLSIAGMSFYKEVSNITGGMCLPFKSSQKTSELLNGYVYTRSCSTEAFNTSMEKVVASGDTELIATYTMLSKSIATL